MILGYSQAEVAASLRATAISVFQIGSPERNKMAIKIKYRNRKIVSTVIFERTLYIA
jgi:hypothetical protein